MKHPSVDWSFADLVQALDERCRDGRVKATRAPDDPALMLYCYTQRAMFDGSWDPVVELARGLVLHHGLQRVVARPFPKFFNFGERSAALPAEPFEVFEKFDGSLGIVFHDGRRWRVATKGSFIAPQGAWAERWLEQRRFVGLEIGSTYLFEIIYGANRIVVRYPFEGLVLLAIFDEAGIERPSGDVAALAESIGARACPTFHYPSLAAMQASVASFAADREGFVIRFRSGYRVKLKGAEYLRIHRLVSRVTPLMIWESLSDGIDLDVIRREIPEEFWSDFDQIRALLEARFRQLVHDVEQERARFAGATDKELGLALQSVPAAVRPFIFSSRKFGDRWFDKPMCRASLHRTFRPDSNVLEGYTASAAIERAQDDG